MVFVFGTLKNPNFRNLWLGKFGTQPAFVYIRHDAMPTFYDRFVECAERRPDLTALEIQRHDHLESCTYS